MPELEFGLRADIQATSTLNTNAQVPVAAQQSISTNLNLFVREAPYITIKSPFDIERTMTGYPIPDTNIIILDSVPLDLTPNDLVIFNDSRHGELHAIVTGIDRPRNRITLGCVFLGRPPLPPDQLKYVFTYRKFRYNTAVKTVTAVINSPHLRSVAGRWPISASEMRAAMADSGIWVSGWPFGAASGDQPDIFGSVLLSPFNAPGYRVAGPNPPGDFAARFNGASTDSFRAALGTTFDLGAADSIAIYLCIRFHTGLLNRWIAGKAGPVANNYGIQLQSAPTGRIEAYVDSGATTLIATADADHWQGGAGNWHDILYVIDRLDQRLQVFTDLAVSPDVDISTVGTLTNALPFHIGAANSATICGCDVAFAGVATGDISNLRANGQAAIQGIQRFTGRA